MKARLLFSSKEGTIELTAATTNFPPSDSCTFFTQNNTSWPLFSDIQMNRTSVYAYAEPTALWPYASFNCGIG